ncbi:MAG TPA: hypothetical protein VGP52_11650 [Stellaceae bacterium]|nr:hypothetical protein [Stellaceae bacterium]
MRELARRERELRRQRRPIGTTDRDPAAGEQTVRHIEAERHADDRVTGQMPADPDDDDAPLPAGIEAQTRRDLEGRKSW